MLLKLSVTRSFIQIEGISNTLQVLHLGCCIWEVHDVKKVGRMDV